VPSRTAQTLCTTLFGLCPWPDVEPYAIAFPSPKPNTSRPPPSGQPPLQVPHFSDIHVDLSYTVGSSYNCSKPMCCRSWTTADAPGNNDYPAGPYGNIHCEAPLSLEETMYSAIETLVPNRSFSIFTGDVIESFVWGVTKTEVINDLADANTRMDRIGQVYSAVGNHESVPVNAYQPNAVSTTGNLWLYGNLATDWQSDIGTAAAGSLAANGGCYSTLWGGSKLRIISLNTNYWYKNNFWLYEVTMERDPSGLFAWLVNELQGAETAGERVWILGHMPMGLADALHDASNYFDQVF
jgi:sphingomyelin phosphodiesterase